MTRLVFLKASWRNLATTMRCRPDRGAVSTMAGMLAACGVVFGATTIVIDVGQLYQARQALQTGTDAAALAVAQACVANPASCGGQSSITLATGLIGDNIPDGQATTVCGTLSGTTGCPAPRTNETACIGDAPEGSFVEIRSQVDVVTPFADALATGANTRHTMVHACSRVSVTAATNTTIAVTVSNCEVIRATTANGFYPHVPGDPEYVRTEAVTAEIALYLHTTDSDGTCLERSSGGDTPGGFGWLSAISDNSCAVAVTEVGTPPAYVAEGDMGGDIPSNCKDFLATVRAQQKEINLPLFNVTNGDDGATGNGKKKTIYTLVETAPFVLTGYPKTPSIISGMELCKGSDKCLYGYFTSVQRQPFDTILTAGHEPIYRLVG